MASIGSPIFKVTPIGGAAQIGSNMTLVEAGKTRILIDCGILFPYEDFFDISYLIPNMDHLGALDALVITHAHEDHIGAITHLLTKYPDLQVYAPSLATELIRFKLERAKISHKIDIYQENSSLQFGDLIIDPIHVNHSIPQTYGLLIRLERLKLSTFYVSDFKVDSQSPYEPVFDFDKLKRLSEKSEYRLLLSDSTNITSSNQKTASEQDVLNGLDPLFSKEGRIFVTSFSSNIHRLQTFINLCAKYQRPLVLYGAAMKKYSQIAFEPGLLKDTENTIRDAEAISSENPKAVIACSGSQGEFKGTLRRIVKGEDPLFKPNRRDRFIFSSKAIPGNEKKLGLLYNQISELGAQIHNDQTDNIHASGHPGKNDLTLVMQSFLPTHHAPIHGESLFLEKHEAFVKSLFPKTKSFRVYNFDSLNFSTQQGDFEIEHQESYPPEIIHSSGHVIQRDKIAQRRKLSDHGVIFISVNSNASRGVNISVTFNGLPDELEAKGDEFKKVLADHYLSLKMKDKQKVQESLRIFTRRYFGQKMNQKPMTFVHVL